MGLLDDAIREHLELKRRSGADARQLAQLEHEAFGPIRRGDPALDVGPAATPAESPEAAQPEEYAYEDAPAADAPGAADEVDWDAPAAPEPGDESRWEDEPAASEMEPLHLPVPETDSILPLTPAHPAEAVEEEWEEEFQLEADAERGHEASAPVDQPTSAYSLEDLESFDEPESAPEPPTSISPPPAPPPPAPPADVIPADDEPGEHDVLEETPEFLEETPEHDRLWFEQKPPKDFDF